MAWTVPTIRGIQLTTAIIVVALALMLFVLVSSAAAVGCLVGGAVVIANLFGLTLVGRWILAAAARSGAPATLGMVAAPLKLLIIVAVIYVICTQTRINMPGFALGVLTQLGAIFVETWRVSSRSG
jgi:ABC-type dipeptide/oligopeptide/nickel transport system permease component